MPPTTRSTLSTSISFAVLALATLSVVSPSSMTTCTGRPSKPPLALIRTVTSSGRDRHLFGTPFTVATRGATRASAVASPFDGFGSLEPPPAGCTVAICV